MSKGPRGAAAPSDPCSLLFSGKSHWIEQVCSDFLYIFSETFFILRRIQRNIIVRLRTSLCKVPVILRFYWKLNFLDIFWKKKLVSNFRKILLVGAELLADGQTDGHDEAYSLWIWHSEDRASWYILTIKAKETHFFSNLFW